jgi:hypothetical protein
MRQLYGFTVGQIRKQVCLSKSGKKFVRLSNGMMHLHFDVVEDGAGILVLRSGSKTVTLFDDTYRAVQRPPRAACGSRRSI